MVETEGESAGDNPEKEAPPSAALSGQAAPMGLADLLRNLFDLSFRNIITTRMMPLIYGLAIALAGLLTTYLIVQSFQDSWALGLVWMFVAGPALFLALVITLRVLLEFFLSIFRILIYLECLVQRTEDIATDMPRVQFWRSWGKDD